MTSQTAQGRTASRESAPALASLIDPVPVAEFADRYWERDVLLRRGDPHRYDSLLTLAGLDEMLSTMSLRASDIRVVQQGRQIPLEELSSEQSGGPANVLEAVYARYRQGATLNLVFLHERHRPLQELCAQLSLELSARVQTNLYLTPGGRNQGLLPHHDTHDVIVLQIHGTKHWALYPSTQALPLQSRRPGDGPGEPLQEFDLEPGDLLYLPRGFVHAATSTDVASCHLTIGFKPILWGPLIRDAVVEVMARDERFRSGMPMGFATQEDRAREAAVTGDLLLEALADQLTSASLVERARQRAWLGRQPQLRGHLLDLERVPGLQLTDRVRRRPGLLWRLDGDEVGRVRLEFHGKQLLLPGDVMGEVRFLSTGDWVTGASIEGDLDDAGRLVLVRRLVTEGFLELDGADHSSERWRSSSRERADR